MSDLDDRDFAIRAPYIEKILELEVELTELREVVRKSKEQEPVAEVDRHKVHESVCVFINRLPSGRDIPHGTKLYAAPVITEPTTDKQLAGWENL